MYLKDKLENHFFWKYACVDNGIFSKSIDLLYGRISIIMKWTYLFLLLFTFAKILNSDYLLEASLVNPLWPIKLMGFISSEFLLYFIQYSLVFLFLFLSCNSKPWILRIITFLIFFVYVSLTNSFGKINHSLHLPLMVLFCFALIPNKKVYDYKSKTILMFASAQFFLLLAYSLTGFWKLFWGIIQLFKGEVSIFSHLSFRNILIEQFQNFEAPILGVLFIEHYVIGWLAYLGVILIELFSILVFFKPKLHKTWGILLILLHFSTAMILNVHMYASIISIGALLIMSPFAYKKYLTTV